MTPLEEYNKTLDLALETKNKAIERATKCQRMQIESAKKILEQCQIICDHEFEDTSLRHRGESYWQEFKCKKCGKIEGVLPDGEKIQ